MRSVTRRLAVMVTTALLAFLGACGGGDSKDGGSPPPPETTTGVLSAGVMSGFGSVYVNGVHYGTDDVTVVMDDVVATVAQLRIGQYVEVKGHEHAYRNQADCDAEIIRYHNVLEGPITSIDAVGGSLVAMGQIVRVTLETVIGDGIQPASIEGLETGDVVEVSGVVPLSGPIDATRIDIKPDGGPYDVTGYVADLQADLDRFQLNDLVIDYNAANMEDFPGGDPAAGDLVLVKGFTFDPDGAFVATRIELRSDDWLKPASGDVARIEGVVVDYVSATEFRVGGGHVATASTTAYENGTAGDLADGVMVRVTGVADATGSLVATRIAFMQVSDVRIVAQVADLDPLARTLGLLGVEVATSDVTHFRDMSQINLRDFGFDDLTIGVWADVRGYEDPEGSGAVHATRVVRIDPAEQVRLRGDFRDPVRPGFRILAVYVETTTATRFVLEGNVRLTADEFFAQAPGELVEAWGSWSAGTLAADRVEIKVSAD